MIRRVSAAAVRPLRQLVLRPHQAISELVYEGDDDPGTFHVAATIDGERLIAVASIYRQAHPDHPHPVPFRLRGMATHPDVRGKGVGGQLLRTAITECQGGSHLWCYARTPAEGFYRRHGFVPHGEAFEIRDIGPHVYMERRIGVLHS